MPIFSLVIPTIHRTQELSRLLGSLAPQVPGLGEAGDLEVLVVDQNPDDRLLPVLEPYRTRFKLVHLKAPSLGQSHAKNLGIRSASGRYMAFPDDDCFYAED